MLKRIEEIEERAEKCDEIVCKIHSSSGRDGIHMSIPPQPHDSDMMLTQTIRTDVPLLCRALRKILTQLTNVEAMGIKISDSYYRKEVAATILEVKKILGQ